VLQASIYLPVLAAIALWLAAIAQLSEMTLIINNIIVISTPS